MFKMLFVISNLFEDVHISWNLQTKNNTIIAQYTNCIFEKNLEFDCTVQYYYRLLNKNTYDETQG